MSKKIVINRTEVETRFAVLEDDALAELVVERTGDRSLVSNVYKGKVARVLPGMNAAFVDIGLDRAAFLFGGDVIDPEQLEKQREVYKNSQSTDISELRDSFATKPIEQMVKQGQEILVQVSKDPIGTKGPRISTFMSLPGRFLVLIPDFVHVAVSRRLEDEPTRDSLRAMIESIKPENVGVIIRTAAEEAPLDHIKRDLEYLINAWEDIKKKQQSSRAPSLLYAEPDLHLKLTRDLYSDDVQEIICDDPKVYSDINSFLHTIAPNSSSLLKLYTKSQPIFDEFGIEMDIARALGRKVWLPSGGYLIIDQAEALAVFDVNTGKFVGTLSARETILKTNLEAVAEICDQLRIRNIGGIIVIDFIDMEEESDRQKVHAALEEGLKKDKAKTSVLPISELGLIQMTRKRTSESLERILMDECPMCIGIGRVRSVETLVGDMLRDLQRHVALAGKKQIDIRIRADINEWLKRHGGAMIEEFCKRENVKLKFKVSHDLRFLKESPFEIT